MESQLIATTLPTGLYYHCNHSFNFFLRIIKRLNDWTLKHMMSMVCHKGQKWEDELHHLFKQPLKAITSWKAIIKDNGTYAERIWLLDSALECGTSKSMWRCRVPMASYLFMAVVVMVKEFCTFVVIGPCFVGGSLLPCSIVVTSSVCKTWTTSSTNIWKCIFLAAGTDA